MIFDPLPDIFLGSLIGWGVTTIVFSIIIWRLKKNEDL